MKKIIIAMCMVFTMMLGGVASAQYVTASTNDWIVDTTSLYKTSTYDFNVLVYNKDNGGKPMPYLFKYAYNEGIWYIQTANKDWQRVENDSVADRVLFVVTTSAEYKGAKA